MDTCIVPRTHTHCGDWSFPAAVPGSGTACRYYYYYYYYYYNAACRRTFLRLGSLGNPLSDSSSLLVMDSV